MADWSNAQRGLVSGFQVGQAASGASRTSGIGDIIAKVADRLRANRESGEAMAQKQNLLGYEGLIKGNIAPAQEGDQGSFNVPGIGNVVSNPGMPLYEKDASGNYVQKGIVPKGSKIVGAGQNNGADKQMANQIADAIVSGDQPPELSRLYRYAGPVRSALAEKGFDLSKASRDWTAVQKTIGSLNSTQQTRMRQALDSVEMSIPALQQLNSELQRSGLQDVNFVTVNAALRGVGPQRDIATRYLTQINAMKDELAQGFMGGGVPTDRAFKLADDILQPMYGKEQFDASLNQLGYNLKIRKNAIEGIAPLSIGGEVNNPKLTGTSNAQQINQPSVDKFQIGQTIVRNGKTYKYIGNNQWSY